MSDSNKSLLIGLAATLRGDSWTWPRDQQTAVTIGQAIREIEYQGVGGLLFQYPERLESWPLRVREEIARSARERAKWELRHKALVSEVLSALAKAEVSALVLKGTALAYDVYASPASRSRGDTDILVSMGDLPLTRGTLERAGFSRLMSDGTSSHASYQEVWAKSLDDGSVHEIDLHWQVMNSPALRPIFDIPNCFRDRKSLPALGTAAFRMSNANALLHACVHRAMHIVSPYFVGKTEHYGGDRLIWLVDIDLLVAGFDAADWKNFVGLAREKEILEACLWSLRDAHHLLSTRLPATILEQLEEAHAEPRSAYLLNFNQKKRAWHDMGTLHRSARVTYMWRRIFPPTEFIRRKYPTKGAWPIAALYAYRAFTWLFENRKNPSAS